MEISIDSLSPHPLNQEIYQDEANEALVSSIREHGILVPLLIKKDSTIISGHRRWDAAKKLGLASVPVQYVEFPDELAEREAVIHSNRQRVKTFSQMMREAEELEAIEQERALQRKSWGGKGGLPQDVPNLAHLERGKTRTKVAEAVGIGGHTQYEKAKKIWQAAQASDTVAQQMVRALDRGEITLHSAFKAVTDKARKRPLLQEQFEVEIRPGDFREVLNDLEPESVKIILTDPPYGKQYLPLWDDLGQFASRILRRDGLLVTYSGQLYLPDVMAILGRHLQWWWLCGLTHGGPGNLTLLGQPVRKVINRFKPLLIYVRKDSTGLNTVFRDLVKGAGKEKDKHNWQQPVSEAREILEMFCSPGDLVVDPFAGSGAFGEAARQVGLAFIGAEILTNNENQDGRRKA